MSDRLFRIAEDYMDGESLYDDHWMGVITITLITLFVGGMTFGFCLAGVLTGYPYCWIGIILGFPILAVGMAGLIFCTWYVICLLHYDKWPEIKAGLRRSITRVDLERAEAEEPEPQKVVELNTVPPSTTRPDIVPSDEEKTRFGWFRREKV